MTDSLFPKIV